MFDESSDHSFVIVQVKQLGFYTDCLPRALVSSQPRCDSEIGDRASYHDQFLDARTGVYRTRD